MDNVTNASCLTVGEGRIYVAINSSFASLGALANLLTILLIAWTRAYRQHVHRLTLYLAILGLCHSITIGLENLPANIDASGGDVSLRSGWNGACATIGFVAQHLGLSKSLMVLGMCFYLFMMAICLVKLTKPVFEVSGLLSVVLLPSLVSWIPFINDHYGLIGVWCWIEYDCLDRARAAYGSYLRLGASLVVDIAPHTLSVVLISTVAVVYCKRSCCGRIAGIRQKHWLVLKEVLPLVSYPLAAALALFFGTANNVALHVSSQQYSRYAGEMVTLCLMQTANLAIPVSFLLHPSVRRSIRAKVARARGGSAWGEGKCKALKEAQESTTAQPLSQENEKSPLYANRAPDVY